VSVKTIQSGLWTLDSAGNNGTFMVHLGHLLAAEPGLVIEFDPEGNRIRCVGKLVLIDIVDFNGSHSCFPHVINIATQTVLKELKENPRLPVVTSSSSLPFAQLAAYADAVESDPISGGRQIVAACRASGQRRSDLQQVIIQGNEAKTWSQNGTIRPVQLLRDCETRWSSTFMMNDRVVELYPVSLSLFMFNIHEHS
jgi:hypothetical protein